MQELSLNVLDIAQNSVRADAKHITISITEDGEKDFLYIEILDDGCGMTPEQVSRVTDPFYTTRTTRKVGLGIPFFKMAAEMADGNFSIQSEKGKGTCVKACFRLSHVDRMPLGDMASTMSLLICANEQIDIHYIHTVNGRVFEVSTAAFQEILQGVPLSNPQISQFIGDYLKENIDALYEAPHNQ